MKTLYKAAFGAACVLALTASAASAEIVCNRDGDCWHVKTRYEYRPEFGVVVHPDSWRWADHEERKYRWREHEGRGYWRDGVWIDY